jgi:hypothetical protein
MRIVDVTRSLIHLREPRRRDTVGSSAAFHEYMSPSLCRNTHIRNDSDIGICGFLWREEARRWIDGDNILQAALAALAARGQKRGFDSEQVLIVPLIANQRTAPSTTRRCS